LLFSAAFEGERLVASVGSTGYATELAVHRVFQCFDDIIGHCCEAWNALLEQPWKIMLLAERAWAHIGQTI
jgi:hypothetical protein